MGGLALLPRGKCNGEGGGHWATGRSCAGGDEKDGTKPNTMQILIEIRRE